QLWYLPIPVGNRTITGPTLAGDMVYATCGMRKDLVAVRLGGAGGVAAGALARRGAGRTPGSPRPGLWEGVLLSLLGDGRAGGLGAKTGEGKGKARRPGDHKASPVAADGGVSFGSVEGRGRGVAASAKFEKLADNRLDDRIIASPAVADGRLYLRGKKALYCIG